MRNERHTDTGHGTESATKVPRDVPAPFDADELQRAEEAMKRLDARKGEDPKQWARKLGAILGGFGD